MKRKIVLLASALLAAATPIVAQSPRPDEHLWVPLVINSPLVYRQEIPIPAPTPTPTLRPTMHPNPTPFPTPAEVAPPCTFTDVGMSGVGYGPYGIQLQAVVAGLQTLVCYLDYHLDSPAVLALAWWDKGDVWELRLELAEIAEASRAEVHLYTVPSWVQSDTVNTVVLWDPATETPWAAVTFPPARCAKVSN